MKMMKQTTTEKTFRIIEDETFHFEINRKIYLTFIQTDNNQYYIEVTDEKELIGRRLKVDDSNARYLFEVFKKQLKSFSYHSEALLCLNLAFSYKSLRETSLVMRLYGISFHHSAIGKIRDRFGIGELKWNFDDPELEDKTFSNVTVDVYMPGKTKPFGYWRGLYLSEYRFHFYA